MKRKYVYLYLLGLLLFSVACTGNFRDYNTDLSGITDDDLIIDDNGFGIRLGIIQQGIYFNYDYGKGKNWPFQLIQNLNADMFSGYMHDGKPLNGGSHNSDYNMQDGWNSAMWTHMYSYIFPQIYQSENATRNTHPALFGITKILKVEAMHRVTDYYGPIIYKNFANAEKHYRPDKQEDVYYEFFNELDSAVVALTNYIDEKPESNGFARFDILLDGKYASWVKFANSLRLRLAMRIASVAPDKACAEIQKIKEREKHKRNKIFTNSENIAFDSNVIAVGDAVKVKGQASIGEVMEIQGKNVVIAFGMLKSTVKIDQLEKISKNQIKREKNIKATFVSEQTADDMREKKLNFKQDIDIRGLRGDEAIQAVTYFIDDAILVGCSKVRILHGTGTGILRQLVRQYLRTVPGVKHFQDEHVQFGGAGITVVDLE